MLRTHFQGYVTVIVKLCKFYHSELKIAIPTPQTDAEDATNMTFFPVILSQSSVANFMSALGTGHFR